MPSPDEQVLSWAARAAGPSARVVSAAGMRAGGNPWLLRLAGAGSTCEVVLKTGDAAADLDRRQLLTTVAALELAADHARTHVARSDRPLVARTAAAARVFPFTAR